DGRVILYPTAIDDPQNIPTYEYDYLLPSFQTAEGASVGGGILAWRVNEDVIYNQGVTGSDGEFYSNFQNNSINTRYNQRGVEIIEADNLPDIGYDWSWFWTGTQYEYFHAKKPVLDGSGYFAGWSLQAWKPDLSGITAPPLEDSAGIGSLYWLGGMGNPGAVMDLSVRSGWFDNSSVTASGIPGLLPGPFINSSYSILDLPLIGPQSITLLSHHDGQWTDLMGPFAWDGQPLDQPVISADQDGNGYKELILTHANSLEIVEFSLDDLQSRSINYPDPITSAPLALRDTVFVSTSTCLSSVVDNLVKDMVQLQEVKRLGSYGLDLVTLSQDLLHIIDTRDLYIKFEVELPEPFGDYEPVGYTADSAGVRMLFLMANSGNVYKFQNNHLQRIWLNTQADKPTQMGITWYSDSAIQGAVNPTIFWGCGTRIYAIKHDGTLLQGYPYNAYPLSFSEREHVYALISYPNILLYLPVADRGHAAYLAGEGILWQRSLLKDGPVLGSRLATGPDNMETNNLFWYYTDLVGKLFIHRKAWGLMNNGIYWNGLRNGGDGSFEGMYIYDELPPTQDFSAFVFPNPVRDAQFRVRIENFDQTVEIRLFDINGSLLQNHTLHANGILRRDVALDSGKLTSGVYILSVRKGAELKRIKFAVEK
ncbi:MAG: T9SS type A sorting domain-containing protein, partial [Candidatus Cloacimonetes bacterium]|nr:T9SS type A sorting domain-containing protein [Candidatus Cloacimonadota bacterium]